MKGVTLAGFRLSQSEGFGQIISWLHSYLNGLAKWFSVQAVHSNLLGEHFKNTNARLLSRDFGLIGLEGGPDTNIF